MSNKGRKDRRRQIQPRDPVAGQGGNPSETRMQFSQRAIIRSHSGPLPLPEVLAGYEEIVPGAADRIIRMAEKQTDHRIDIEKQVIGSDIRKSKQGMIFGFIVAIAGFALAFGIVMLGYPTTGTLFGCVPLATLVTVFVRSSSIRQTERENMRQAQNPRHP